MRNTDPRHPQNSRAAQSTGLVACRWAGGMASVTMLLAAQSFGCGGAQPEPDAAPPEPVSAPPPVAKAPPPPPPEPTAEELKAKADAERLAKNYEELKAATAAEVARLTPEIRAEATKLAGRNYYSGRVAIPAAQKGSHRRPGNADRDAVRHPLKTLQFFGFKPNQTVLEYGPGAGWYTELLAPALAKRGSLFVTNTDPAGPESERATYYAKRTDAFLQTFPEQYNKVTPYIADDKEPKLGAADGSLDLVLLVRGTHGMVNRGALDKWLAEFHRTLKPRAVLGIVQHRAAEGADATASSKNGYLPEQFVIDKVSAAGFKLSKKSELNANPKDTKDHPDGVWSLPPTFRGGDVDKEKFVAIGESDRMTLKFVRIAKPVAKKP